ncbi:MAG: FGGY-family carbohydrate kinase, partial [Bacteroidota bacterium]
LGLTPGIPVAYRAGDQPNNAFSLNVLNPGEVAATAGTSGVVYGVSDETKYDPFSRVNTFAHVNHLMEGTRLGVLLCINGTGIMNSWTKQNMASTLSYEEMNRLAEVIEPGSENLQVFPFGNGAERMLNNKDTGCQVNGLNFNIHNRSHFIRAEQEGIVFSFKYGMEIMEQTGIVPQVIRAGNANMFLSPVFRESLASLTGATIELYNTDGSQGAARGAGIGAGIYKNTGEAFENLEILGEISPSADLQNKLDGAYQNWKKQLVKLIQ